MISTSQNSPQEGILIRLASSEAEIQAAQNLRYRVFYKEYGAIPSTEMIRLERDFDEYDTAADHLIVTDSRDGHEEIVGTYRLLTRDSIKKLGHFYSAQEFDLSLLLNSDYRLLELGRSCVVENYRAGPVLQLLWQGIADYITTQKIDIMFGCASLHSMDIEALKIPLSYMHHFHLADETLRPKALDDRYINMNMLPKDAIDEKAAFTDLPPLIKGYLRVGAAIGDGAVLDPQFNTTDVCIIANTGLVASRYKKHYERKIQKEISG